MLTRLDEVRKGSVVRFLYESGLITGNHPILSLSGADLGRADLSGASLRRAAGVTKRQLEQVKSLERAKMPNGQKMKSGSKTKRAEGNGRVKRANWVISYGDWLKGRREDGTASDPL